jgi:hypothetical protein
MFERESKVGTPMFIVSFNVLCLSLPAALLLAGCKDAPGADGRYAHGYGYLYRAGDGPWAP